MKYIIMIIFLVGCGMKHNVEGDMKAEAKIETDLPDRISFEPDFQKAAKFCDDRYGEKTSEAEDCFQDFRDYYKATVGIDFDAILDYCAAKYEEEELINECEEDILDIIGEQKDE